MSTRPSPTGLTSPFTVLFQVHNEQIVLGVRLWAQDANQAERLALKKCEQLGPPEVEYAHGGSIGSRGPTFGSSYESIIIGGHPEITADLLCGEPTWVTGGPWAGREAPDSASLVGMTRASAVEVASVLMVTSQVLHAREEPVTVPLKEGMSKLNLTAAVDNAARLVNTALDEASCVRPPALRVVQAPGVVRVGGWCDSCGKNKPTSTLNTRSCSHTLCADCAEALTEGTFLRGAE